MVGTCGHVCYCRSIAAARFLPVRTSTLFSPHPHNPPLTHPHTPHAPPTNPHPTPSLPTPPPPPPPPPAALGLRHSTLYAANGLALVASFFVCRIVWTAFMSVYFWKCTAEAMAGRMDPGTSVWVIYLGRSSLVALGSLNVYWFSKMLGYLVKVSWQSGSSIDHLRWFSKMLGLLAQGEVGCTDWSGACPLPRQGQRAWQSDVEHC